MMLHIGLKLSEMARLNLRMTLVFEVVSASIGTNAC